MGTETPRIWLHGSVVPVDENQDRCEAFQLPIIVAGVAEDDHDVAFLHQSCGCSIYLHLTGAGLTRDCVGLKAGAVVDIDHVHGLEFEDMGQSHQLGVDGQRAYVIEVAGRDSGAVNLALEQRTLQSISKIPNDRFGRQTAHPGSWMSARRARLASWLISGTCLAGFLVWAVHQPVPRLPSGFVQGLALLLGAVAYLAATLGLCERWWFLLRSHVPGVTRLTSYRPVVLGQLGNVFLPARAGDGLRVGMAAATHEGVSTRIALGAVLAERALDIGCHAILLTVVLLGMFGPSAGALGGVPAVLLGLVLLAGSTAAVYLAACTAASRLDVGRRMPQIFGPLLAPLLGLRDRGARAVRLSVAMWSAEVVGWWAAAHAVGLDLDISQTAYVFAVASLALIMPVGFGSIGTLDAGILFSVKTIGVGTAPVLSFVLLLRALFVLPSIALVVGIELRRRLVRAGDVIAPAGGRGEPFVDV